jgi:hypothetical protein
MSVYFIYAIQIALVVHVLKTGRSRYWIWLLIFLPLIAGAAYVLIELLPELSGSIAGQRALRGVRKTIDPGGAVKRQAAAWDQSPNADNARRYAEALLENEETDTALEVLDTALSGFFSTEPSLLQLRAQAQFKRDEAAAAVETLELLQQHNPEFRSAEGHLLFARALEASDRMTQALDEYRSVVTYFPGAEARYRLGMALQKGGFETEAQTELEQMIADAGLAPAHFRKSQKPWLEAARKALE